MWSVPKLHVPNYSSKAGANVLMPNFTPAPYKKLYDIYPNKRCISESTGACGPCMGSLAVSIGRTVA